MRVVVDGDLCTGHGRCYALAPDLFGPDDYGHCELLVADGVIDPALEPQARAGAEKWPGRAITLEP